MPFALVRNDIVHMQVDAVVNAANIFLRPGGGVCGAIFSNAGHDRLVHACRKIGHCPVGGAVITPGFDLPAKYIIHAVGPVWQGGEKKEGELLRSAYLSALNVAKENHCESIAFPLISSGIYGYPKAEAFRIAVAAIQDFLMENEMTVYLIVYGRSAVVVGEKLFMDIQSYIDDHYVEEHDRISRRYDRRYNRGEQIAQQLEEQESYVEKIPSFSSPSMAPSAPEPKEAAESDPFEDIFKLFERRPSLDEVVSSVDDSFSKLLFRQIDKRGMSDVEVYKRANIDRKLFNKLKKDSYNPSKRTVLALCIGLRLNLDETKDLLGRAGYALSPSSKADLIVQYYISNGIYDIYEINEALFSFDQKVLA